MSDRYQTIDQTTSFNSLLATTYLNPILTHSSAIHSCRNRLTPHLTLAGLERQISKNVEEVHTFISYTPWIFSLFLDDQPLHNYKNFLVNDHASLHVRISEGWGLSRAGHFTAFPSYRKCSCLLQSTFGCRSAQMATQMDDQIERTGTTE